jgi:hypothetical protein
MEKYYGRSGPSGAGYRVHQHEVEHRESLSVSGCTEHSDEQDAKQGARSGREQAMRCE